MTRTERLRAALSTLRWGPQATAGETSINERTVRRWLSGEYDPPDDVLEWLDRLAAFHKANPPPIRE